MAEKHGNKWRVKVRREDGTRGYRSFDTEAEADGYERAGREWASARVPIDDRTRIRIMRAERSTLTVYEYGKDLIADPELRPNTLAMYETALRRVGESDLGRMPLTRVKAADVRQFFSRLKANRDNVRAVLAKVFNAAVREGLIPVSPLMQASIKPSKPNGRATRHRIRALSADQLEALARAARNERDALAIRLGGYVGLRAGEVGGLRIEDVDFESCRISVRRNASRDRHGHVIFGDPKTATSERTLKVPCSLMEDLRRFIDAHPPRADGTIFYTYSGNPMTEQPLTHMVVAAAKRVGLYRKEDGRQWPTFHKLRNTCASLLIAAKMEPKAIQAYLGHSSIRMTYDLYGDLFPKADEPLALAMEELRAVAERKALPAGDAEDGALLSTTGAS